MDCLSSTEQEDGCFDGEKFGLGQSLNLRSRGRDQGTLENWKSAHSGSLVAPLKSRQQIVCAQFLVLCSAIISDAACGEPRIEIVCMKCVHAWKIFDKCEAVCLCFFVELLPPGKSIMGGLGQGWEPVCVGVGGFLSSKIKIKNNCASSFVKWGQHLQTHKMEIRY